MWLYIKEKLIDIWDWIDLEIHCWVIRPIKDSIWWIRYRTTHRYHIINTKLKPGYHDTSSLVDVVLFELLVDFVELEKAHMELILCTGDEYGHKWESRLYRWLPEFLTRSYRSRKFGIKYLEWEAGLDDPSLDEYERSPYQAHAAREILELYKWYKDELPGRIDPFTAFHDYCNLLRRKYQDESRLDFFKRDLPEDEDATQTRLLKLGMKLEERYYDEDTERMHRILKIRSSLWT
jgi:hypothetical protein